MTSNLYLYNTLTRKKEQFEPINPPFVGLYSCGPTVYGDAHLGHARQAITFDVLFRYLGSLGYRVRYVRNITDVGHLENDADQGEDKIQKRARIEELEPMEVVQRYMNAYHRNMRELNLLPPSIEPRATGHIIEQQELIRRIMEAGYAYEVNGSVYFDVPRYSENHDYGVLSGRKTDELLANTRQLEGQGEKHSPLDFALWKKAEPSHLMRWKSEWSEGYPGWHLECSAMSTRYLGMQFDIHGGGMDLLFPHHECEIAQNVAGYGQPAVRYWMHNNMITINGQKMGRSLGNSITLDQLFTGDHRLLERAYLPMAVKFFILQAHYRSTLDFSNEALQASEKGYRRLIRASGELDNIRPGSNSTIQVGVLESRVRDAMNDDMNTPLVIGHLFEGIRWIKQLSEGKESISGEDLDKMKSLYHGFLFDILGLKKAGRAKTADDADTGATDRLVELILRLRREARESKDFQLSDRLRDELSAMGITIRDTKDGAEWEFTGND